MFKTDFISLVEMIQNISCMDGCCRPYQMCRPYQICRPLKVVLHQKKIENPKILDLSYYTCKSCRIYRRFRICNFYLKIFFRFPAKYIFSALRCIYFFHFFSFFSQKKFDLCLRTLKLRGFPTKRGFLNTLYLL